ncbi:MAG: SGNH/GDSL hydrolase family protein [Akkermansiaceae bacterium]|jgi:lysophospholipase L1-like esterase
MNRIFSILSVVLLSVSSMASASEKLLEGKKTILILGDSITQMGDYVTDFDAWLVKKYPDRRFTVVNAGVASETISGLSEDNHAGGRFPRPDLHERLERVLEKTKPDLIIACYGMNCGIYKELDDQRVARFQEGNLKLRAAAKKYNAEVVHMTPPIFDNHGKPGFDYDTVLSAYSAWMVKQRENGWHVVDLHSDMRKKVDHAKASDPKFTVQKDTIHPDAAGHWMMAQPLIAFFGDTTSAQLASANDLLDAARLVAVKQRMQFYQKAVHAETKPLRPGVPQGGTLESAAAEAKKLEDIIYTIKS